MSFPVPSRFEVKLRFENSELDLGPKRAVVVAELSAPARYGALRLIVYRRFGRSVRSCSRFARSSRSAMAAWRVTTIQSDTLRLSSTEVRLIAWCRLVGIRMVSR
jgi:hypothetical protein